MKALYWIALLLLTTAVSLQAQATFTLNQTFSTMGAQQIQLDVPSDAIVIKTTKGSRIIVESNVRLSTPNENLMQFLVKTKRYELTHEYNAERKLLTLKRPRPESAVVYQGEEVEEYIKYTLYLPQKVALATAAAKKVAG